MAPKRQQTPKTSHKEPTSLIQQGAPDPQLERQLQEALARRELSLEFKHTRQHSGPIPAADEMAAYNDVIPDGAERIMRMAEQSAEHARLMDASQENRAHSGIRWAGCITLGCLALAAFALYLGHTATATTIVGVGMAAVAGPFIWGTTLNYKERMEAMKHYRANSEDKQKTET